MQHVYNFTSVPWTAPDGTVYPVGVTPLPQGQGLICYMVTPQGYTTITEYDGPTEFWSGFEIVTAVIPLLILLTVLRRIKAYAGSE